MSKFKSFSPKKYSRRKDYKPGGAYYCIRTMYKHNEFCANCGFTFGSHRFVGDTCPSECFDFEGKKIKPIEH